MSIAAQPMMAVKGGDDMPNPEAPDGTSAPVVAAPSSVTTDSLIETEAFDLVGTLSAFDESAYVWDLTADVLQWEDNAPAVFGLDSFDEIEDGKSFEDRIVPEHRSRRSSAVHNGVSCPHDRGVPYRVQYRFHPGPLRGIDSIWIEDHGRWWPGDDGKPVRARGIVRVVNESFVAEQAALFGSDGDESNNSLSRTRLPQAIAAVLNRAEKQQGQAAFLMIAVNNLASVNETLGFDIGDEVLNATGQIIKSRLRSGDVLGRYSSNKFGVIISNCGPGAMRVAAERFMKAVRQTPINTTACQLSATVSVGGIAIPGQASTVRQVFSRSLHALEAAKSRRFDSFVSFDTDADHEAIRQRRITIADDIMSALDDDRMRLVLQPIINSKTRKADLYECLLRMEKPDGSIVSAGEFIPFAEQFGLLRLIDKRTLELSVALLRKHPRLSLSLNVSSMTALDQDWLSTLQNLSEHDRALTKRLVLEITETKVIDDIDQAVAFVDTLREMGCRVAIDDFGAGYTSFKNLKHLPVDLVKIDGAFVKNLPVDSSDKVFIKTMVELAETFGMETVAEWVRDEETAEILTKAGITYLQGFHFGQPIPADELPDDA